MAGPSSNDDEAEQFGKLWKLLNTPVGDLQSSDSLLSGKHAESTLQQNSSASNNQRSNIGQNATQKYPGGSSERGFSKRHSSKQTQGKKQHNFRETTRRIGFNAETELSPIGQSDTRAKDDGKRLYKPGFFTLFFGVFLPILAMSYESSTHFLAKEAFDPFPTTAHLFLFSLIPISNFLNWLAVRRNIAPLYSIISLSTGMALGIAILYSIMLMPLTGTFLMASVYFGMGLLGLAPLLSIPITLMCGSTICQLADRQKTYFDAHQLKHLGHLIILVMVLSVELPSTLTRMHLSMADEGKPGAIQWLRQWGNQDVLLRACYERSGEATDILGTMAEHNHPVNVERAREIFYKVTGVSFNSVPIPASFRGTIKHAGLIADPANLNEDVKDEFDLDPDIAGELVSGVARGLSISDSSITGSLDSGAGIASLDWNFTFENVSTIPREARAKIILPPNAVVTKATLWLDNLQRETVIQERNLARTTYQESVTSHKRDPLLVSMAGKDSVLVQCYPVVKGTKTKIRLHIIAPLVVSSEREESLIMPTFEERNFAITIPHKVDFKSRTKISLNGTDSSGAGSSTDSNGNTSITSIKGGAGLTGAKGNAVSTELKTDIQNSLMSRFEAVVRVGMSHGLESAPLMVRPPESRAEIHKTYYSMLPDTALPNVPAQLRLISGKPADLVVIVDKSITMSPYIHDIAEALKDAPKSLPITLIEVKDFERTLCIDTRSDHQKFQSAIKVFAESKCEGGQSDASLLHDMLTCTNRSLVSFNADVLWIHAAQPVANHSTSDLLAALRSTDPSLPRLYDLQVCSGPNAILTESYAYPKLNRIVRTGSLSQDIVTFMENYANNTIRRTATTYSALTSGSDSDVNLEVSQVQAYKLAIARFQASDNWGAYELANRYHLVTPVSSAVVTEEPPIAETKLAELAKERDTVTTDEISEVAAAPPPSKFQGIMRQQKLDVKEQQQRQSYMAKRSMMTDFRQSGDMAYTKSKVVSAYANEKKQLNEEFKGGSSFQNLNPTPSSPSVDIGSSKDKNANTYASDGFSSSSENTSASGIGGTNPYVSTGAPIRLEQASAIPVLQGATNGTIGPQGGDATSIFGLADREKSADAPQQEAQPAFGRRYHFEPQHWTSNPPTLERRKQESRKAGFSPFSDVATKLNSLSSAAGTSNGPPGALSDASSSQMRPYNTGFESGQASGDMLKYREQQAQSYKSTSPTEDPVFMLSLIATGLAFLLMLTVLFRLLIKNASKDNDLNMKP